MSERQRDSKRVFIVPENGTPEPAEPCRTAEEISRSPETRGASPGETRRMLREIEALKRAERRLATIFHSTHDAIIIHDLDGRILEVNEKMRVMYGLTRERALSATIEEISAPDMPREAVREKWERVMAGEPQLFEWKARRPLDGAAFHVEVSLRRIDFEDRDVILANVRYIEGRKRAEAVLRAKTEELEHYFSNSLDLLCIADMDGYFHRLNPQWRQTLGYDLDELAGKRFMDFVHPDDRPSTLAAMAQLGNSREVLNFTNRYRHKDGSYRWIEWRSMVAGKMIYAAARDVTERTLAEDRLRRSREELANQNHLFEALLRNLRIGVFMAEAPSGKPLLANDEARRILGRGVVVGATKENLAETYRAFKLPERILYPAEALPIARALRGESSEVDDMLVIRPDGTEIELEVIGCPVRDARGRIAAALISFEDVTDRRRAEAEREQLQTQLHHARKMEAVGTLAGGVAHDFNNILQAIGGYTQLLTMRKPPGDPDRAPLETIQKAVDRAARLVRQLLLFSRKAETRRQSVNLNLEARQAIQILERTIPRMIRIDLDPGEDLWPVRADSVQIEQVLLNLGGNAADAMPDGGVLHVETRNLTLDAEFARNRLDVKPGRWVLLSVSDTGCGMDPETRAHIFDPFFTTKESGKGTGLGLSSVYGIVQSHGGRIQCYSEPGRGTTFRIYWPAEERAGEIPDGATAIELPPGGPETVLIVDDERDVRELTAEALETRGYGTLTAADGEKALALYAKKGHEIDLVLLDLGMPGMGGRRCLRELLRMDPGVRVLVASGYAFNGNAGEIAKAGAAGFIGKPYPIAELLAKVREILDG